ncbi:hypothetical protein ACFC5Z_26685, partial [Streptomyces sp. NPDC056004]|uniref:hypothetical protein n=1 Tax=Streptomyces sp. NPDC056004 TaxID=3345677 RepID=UPI0035D699E5
VQSDADALTAARDALSAYQQAVATPGTANFLQIANLLDELSGELAAHHQPADAVDATARRASICLQHADSAHLEAALVDLAGLYARAPGLRIVRAVITSPDANLLASAIRENGSRIVSENGVRRGPDSMPRVQCYASNETLDLLRAQGITVEIIADVTTSLLSRRDVNVQEDQFADGSVPTGVGKLI